MSNRLPDAVLAALAADLACEVGDLEADRNTVTVFRPMPGRRRFPVAGKMLHIVTIGGGAVICVDPTRETWAREFLAPLPADSLFSRMGLLAVLERLTSEGQDVLGPFPSLLCSAETVRPVEMPPGFRIERLEGASISGLYRHPGLRMALSYQTDGARPDTVATAAWAGSELAAVAACSADNDDLWQVGADVLPPWRRCGLGAALVQDVTRTVLAAGRIPYTSCGMHNVASQRIAFAIGYRPAWTTIASRECC